MPGGATAVDCCGQVWRFHGQDLVATGETAVDGCGQVRFGSVMAKRCDRSRRSWLGLTVSWQSDETAVDGRGRVRINGFIAKGEIAIDGRGQVRFDGVVIKW